MNKQINCKIDNGAFQPKYETICASGMDLKAWKYSLPKNPNDIIDFTQKGIDLLPHERVKILTGLHIEFPKDIEGQLRPRSGLTFKNGIITQLGTIDEDYTGDISLVVLNTSNIPFHINKGDRLGQIVFSKVEKFDLNVVDELSKTLRGENGFNSTGIK